MRTYWTILLCLLTLGVSSCSPPQPQAIPLAENPSEQTHSSTAPSGLNKPSIDTQATPMNKFVDDPGAALPPTSADSFVNIAKEDLANRLNIGTDQITALKTIEITWTDITKGCSPGTGQILSKGKLTGYRIWLQTSGEEYVYHVGLDHQIILCPKFIPGANNPLLMTPSGSPEAPQDQSP